jgi:tetratricopeptide (TPR) repeat protein
MANLDSRNVRVIALLAVLPLLFVGADASAQQEFQVEASVDRTVATLDDQILLEVVVRGVQRSAAPAAPATLEEDFDAYYRGSSQSISIVNGEMSASNTFTWLLVPKREGKLVIGPFEAGHRGRRYKTDPITIEVSGRASGRSGTEEGRDLFVVTRVDKEEAFVNEQIRYTFYLYSAVRVSNLNYSPPQFEGFWVEKLQEGEKQYHKIVNGRQYRVIEVSTAIFPTTSGTLGIDPARLRLVELTDRSFSFFDRGVERVLRSRPVEVEVKPLPASGRPADFGGAVGEDLAISAKLDQTEVEEGEPVTMTVRVRGAGNVRTFSKPRVPELPQFKVYDADTQTDVRSLDRVTGSRTWEVVLVPREAGEFNVPPVRLSYFDTRSEKYSTIETDPMRIIAVRTARSQRMLAEARPHMQQEIEVLGEDIAHIRTDVAVSDQLEPLYAQPVFLALLPLPLLAVGAAFAVRRRRDQLASDVALARSSRARKIAHRSLSQAERFLKAGRSEEFYAEVSRALLQYVGDKLNVSASGLTHDDLREHLSGAGANEDTCERVVQVLEHCDAARFSPGSFTEEKMRSTQREVESLIAGMEDRWSRKASRFVMASLALCSALLAWGALSSAPLAAPSAQRESAPQSSASDQTVAADEDVPLRVEQEPVEFVPPQDLLQRANAAYEEGRFAEAIDRYRRAEAMGVRNGPLYYNLGNAYFKSGDLVRAIANYRRAERLMPRDGLLRANLEFVLLQREDKAVQPPNPWMVVVAKRVFRWMNLNEWLLVTAALYVLTCAVALYRILAGRKRLVSRVLLYAAAGLLLLSSLTLASKARDERGIERGVVTAERIAVMSGPGQDYTVEFWLHEGSEVRIEVERPDWLRVSMGGSLRGWIPAASLARI